MQGNLADSYQFPADGFTSPGISGSTELQEKGRKLLEETSVMCNSVSEPDVVTSTASAPVHLVQQANATQDVVQASSEWVPKVPALSGSTCDELQNEVPLNNARGRLEDTGDVNIGEGEDSCHHT